MKQMISKGRVQNYQIDDNYIHAQPLKHMFFCNLNFEWFENEFKDKKGAVLCREKLEILKVVKLFINTCFDIFVMQLTKSISIT